MRDYGYIENVLGGIFGAELSRSDEDAVRSLRSALHSPDFKKGIERELRSAFSDASFSWLGALTRNGVGVFESEEAAGSFAREFIYDVVFSQ